MRTLSAALWSETVKTRKSKIFWITLGIFSFVALIMGLMVYLSQHPDLVKSSQLMSAKTSLFMGIDWPAYIAFLYEIVAIIGFIGFGFVIAWVFGREYSDNTLKDLLALPVPRHIVVIAKYIIAAVWSLIIATIFFLLAIFSGMLTGMDHFSGQLLVTALQIYAGTALLTLVVSTPVAFFASWGKGFMLPLGYLILILIITQFVSAGFPSAAPYLPWAFPALWSGAGGEELSHPDIASYMIFVLTGITGFAGTILWWRYADQK